MIDEAKLQARMQRIAELVRRLDSVADAEVRAQSRELMESVMDLHGEALERILSRLRETGEAGQHTIGDLSADPVVSSVLLLYGLHPLDFESRVRGAVEKVRPDLRIWGSDAELLELTGAAIRIRVRGADNTHTARSVRTAIEDAIYAAAPDAASLVLVGLEEFAAADFVPLGKVGTVAAGQAGG